MKTYVFFTSQICRIGGVEQYLHNKVKYLESQGWRVLVFSARHGQIMIHDLEKYEPLIIPTLEHCPECFTKRDVEKVLNKISSEIGDCHGDNCIIESHSATRAVWAELVAQRLNCRHLSFILQESHKYDSGMQAFLRFKYDRHELAGIANASVGLMLGDATIEARQDTRISAFCNDVIEDCEDTLSESLNGNADYTFASIGRLEKPCVLPIVRGFHAFFQSHPTQIFNLVMIGGSPVNEKEKEDQIRGILKDCSNVKLIMAGYVYPIPCTFVNRVDVFVSTAGAAVATYRVGRPTVRVHPITGAPSGIIGLDFQIKKKSLYESTPGMSIESCIDRAINCAASIVYEYSGQTESEYQERMHKEFERQLSFVRIADSNQYYDRELLMRLKTPGIRHHSLKRVIGHVFGGKGQEQIREIKKRLLKK